MMLNVRRASVTDTMCTFGHLGLTVARRSHIIIKERPGLERLAAGGYGAAEAQYERPAGVALRRAATAPHRAVNQEAAKA